MGRDGTARLWNAHTGELQKIFWRGLELFAAAWSPDGSTLAIGGDALKAEGRCGVVRFFDAPYQALHSMGSNVSLLMIQKKQ